jgi:2-oxoglutarate dehydrogenase E2 component (dihydrolipoamide succinyltransferase)
VSDITMPQLGETVTEGTITKWHKAVGDPVKEDEILFEVSTDKVDSEVPSPISGYVTEILVNEGETVDVGARLAVVSTEAPSADGGKGAPEPAEASVPTRVETAPEPVAEPVAVAEPSPVAVAEPVPPPPLEAAPAPRPAPEPAVSAPRPVAEPAPAPARVPSGPAGNGEGLVLSPVVRRLLTEHDLDPASIHGTGAGGRITRADVLAVIDQGSAPSVAPAPAAPAAPAASPARPAAPVAAVPPPAPAPVPAAAPAGQVGPRDEIIPFSNIRRRTAEHMVRSKHTSAHTVVAMEVDYAGVDRVRLAAKEHFRAEEGISLTYLPFISRAVIDAIARYPEVNASVGDDELIVHHAINLGIAVDLDLEGLIVPVIHEADGKRLRVLARQTAELAARARAKKLTADDIAGGTFTLTNAGPFGTLFTVPVINQPQVAIIATDGVRKRPVVVETADGSDAIVVHPVGNLVLAFDHRAFDGAYASAFMALVKEILETRDWSQEL